MNIKAITIMSLVLCNVETKTAYKSNSFYKKRSNAQQTAQEAIRFLSKNQTVTHHITDEMRNLASSRGFLQHQAQKLIDQHLALRKPEENNIPVKNIIDIGNSREFHYVLLWTEPCIANETNVDNIICRNKGITVKGITYKTKS